MSVPAFTARGELVLESLLELTVDDFAAWVRDWLSGTTSVASIRPGEEPHHLLLLSYPRLPSHMLREDLQRLLAQFLSEFAVDSTCIWRGDAGAELFQLLDPVLVESAYRGAAIDSLRLALNRTHGAAVQHGSVNHRRALQGLISLGHHADPGFWKAQGRLGGPAVAPTVFDALVRIEVVGALTWLQESAAPSVASILITYLPFCIGRGDLATLRPSLVRLLAGLPRPEREAIEDFARTLELNLHETAVPDRNIHHAVLTDLLHDLRVGSLDRDAFVKRATTLVHDRRLNVADVEVYAQTLVRETLTSGASLRDVDCGLALVEQFPSPPAVEALVSYLAETLAGADSVTDAARAAALRVRLASGLTALRTLRSSLRMFRSSGHCPAATWLILVRCLRHSLRIDGLRFAAFEELVFHAAEITELVEPLQILLGSAEASVDEAVACLERVHDRNRIEDLLRMTVLKAAHDADAVSVAKRLYAVMPTVFQREDGGDAQALVLAQDQVVDERSLAALVGV